MVQRLPLLGLWPAAVNLQTSDLVAGPRGGLRTARDTVHADPRNRRRPGDHSADRTRPFGPTLSSFGVSIPAGKSGVAHARGAA